MKAAVFNKYGGPEVIEITEIGKPVPEEGQVLVEVHAASINPIDFKIREGYLKDFAPLNFPAVLGGNFSGIVSQLGDGVSQFKLGDEVYGQALVLNGGSGGMAEFLVANAGNTAIKPKNTDHIEAASLPLAGVSALQGLTDLIDLQKGQKILIQGGAGGIGSIAIQIAKSIGGHTATTVSTKDVEFAKGLGADEVIDYKKDKFEEVLKELDAVFDVSPGAFSEDSLKVLKKGGIFVSMTTQADEKLVKKYGVTAIAEQTDTSRANLDRLRDLVEKGKVMPQVDKIFPLEKTRKAFVYKETGHPRGKVVVRVK